MDDFEKNNPMITEKRLREEREKHIHCLDKAKVKEVIDIICTFEWENCGKRLKNELRLE